MGKKAVLLLAFWIAVVLLPWALSASYYVSTTGSDSGQGTLEQPFKTVQRAADKVVAGDSVLIRAGVYHESVAWITAGTQQSPISVRGYPGENAVLDGNNYMIPANGGNGLFTIWGSWYIVSDLEFRYSGDTGVTVAISSTHTTLSNIYVHHNWGGGVILSGNYSLAQNSRLWSNSMVNYNYASPTGWGVGISCARYPDFCTIRNCTSWETWGEGISTFEALHTTIEDCTSYDNQQNYYISDTKYSVLRRSLSYCTPGNMIDPYETQCGILVGDEKGVPIPLGPNSPRFKSSDNTIINNLVMGCNRNLAAGAETNNVYAFNTFVNQNGSTSEQYNVLFYAGVASNQTFANNIILQEDNHPISIASLTGMTFSHNLWSRVPTVYTTNMSSPTDIIGDPRLVRSGVFSSGRLTPDWFRLLPSSPAIDKARVLTVVQDDFSKNPRGSNPDIGAFEYQQSAAQTVYYVATTGNDFNPGTQTQPWLTIQHCLGHATPGITCNILGGVYRERLVLNNSGTRAAPITLRAYTQPVTVYAGTASAITTKGRVGFYTIEGMRFVSDFFTDAYGEGATLDFAGDRWVGETATTGGNDGFFVRDCSIAGRVQFYGSNNTVEGCDIDGNSTWGNGIVDNFAVCRDNTYQNNVIHDFAFRGVWSMQRTENIRILNNTIYNTKAMGIDCDGAGAPVFHCLVQGNTVSDISGEGTAIEMENAFNSRVEKNWIYNVRHAFGIINYGCMPDYCTAGAIEYRYTVTNITISNNVIFNATRAGLLCHGAQGGKAYGNTFSQTGAEHTYWGTISLDSYGSFFCHNWDIQNNIVSGNLQNAVWLEAPVTGLTGVWLDYNLYDVGSAEKKFVWKQNTSTGIWNETAYTLQQYRAFKGIEPHVVLGSPGFLSARDFHLASTSRAIDAGANIASLREDYDGIVRPVGTGYDIGAYEFTSAISPLIGDVTHDGKVDLDDVRLVAHEMGKVSGFDPDLDLNTDGKVDLRDLVIAAQHYGTTIAD